MNIAAISTPPGIGGIAIIRVSGPDAIEIVDSIFVPSRPSHTLNQRHTHTITFGQIRQSNGELLDEVVVSVYKTPHSFTGENVVEISCHGSRYVQQAILSRLLERGCRLAEAGEFTRRAFSNGRMDLSQAEAVADLIASENAAAHRIAINQMKGGFSKKLAELRLRLIDLCSLLELELDFSEEDVEFADRNQLSAIAQDIRQTVTHLADSFQTGNAIKNGIPVTIIGETNAGKSTLLNRLLGDDKAIVSDIHGTTRDVIEETSVINGVLLRFIDTAGIRDTSDKIENIGIERTYQRIEQARIVLWMIDGTRLGDTDLADALIADARETLQRISPHLREGQHLYVVINKTDLITPKALSQHLPRLQAALCTDINAAHYLAISAHNGEGVEQLIAKLHQTITLPSLSEGDIIISNIRHYEALTHAREAIDRVITGLNTQLSGDLIAEDLKECNHWLGTIVGEVSSNEILATVFGRFCIGK